MTKTEWDAALFIVYQTRSDKTLPEIVDAAYKAGMERAAEIAERRATPTRDEDVTDYCRGWMRASKVIADEILKEKK